MARDCCDVHNLLARLVTQQAYRVAVKLGGSLLALHQEAVLVTMVAACAAGVNHTDLGYSRLEGTHYTATAVTGCHRLAVIASSGARQASMAQFSHSNLHGRSTTSYPGACVSILCSPHLLTAPSAPHSTSA